MAKDSYIYAVARIRSHELQLLNAAFMEQLLAAPDEAGCLRLLSEHGWGTPDMSAEQMLDGETEKTWELIRELVGDLSVFHVFLYENDYHNLKAAIKEACTGGRHPGIYVENSVFPACMLEEAVESRSFGDLPEHMREPAERAMDTLLSTRDGQLCDCIIDRAALCAIRKAGAETGSELLALYGELTAAIGDIKTAVRALRTGKSLEFLRTSLAPCATLDEARLSEAAESMEALVAYLDTTIYADAVPELEKSPAAFECWCDNYLIRRIRPQLSNSFGIDPLAAYILARRMEIRSVRIILTGKRNDMAESLIRGRVRETYV
ncbi:V-type ATPase subunit [Lachnoclostridium sp. Marseille-P6806]|uniref:V-type ATPase subunit n=1 Tax=Lachnoclostridium sp. Marseille-P6806 TaxID=2364793 RepID=UPI001031A554|nr:V-type ATPase subunit [Lachnoclostridium sp. Marseille-P6806]